MSRAHVNAWIESIAYTLESDGAPGVPGHIRYYPQDDAWWTDWRSPWSHDTPVDPADYLGLISARHVCCYSPCRSCGEPAESGNGPDCSACWSDSYRDSIAQDYRRAIWPVN